MGVQEWKVTQFNFFKFCNKTKAVQVHVHLILKWKEKFNENIPQRITWTIKIFLVQNRLNILWSS